MFPKTFFSLILSCNKRYESYKISPYRWNAKTFLVNIDMFSSPNCFVQSPYLNLSRKKNCLFKTIEKIKVLKTIHYAFSRSLPKDFLYSMSLLISINTETRARVCLRG